MMEVSQEIDWKRMGSPNFIFITSKGPCSMFQLTEGLLDQQARENSLST